MRSLTAVACTIILGASAGEVHSGGTAQGAASPAGLIFGRVVDADAGTPLPGVLVTALPAIAPSAPPAARPERPQSILTDVQGRFVFRDLPAATYTLAASVGGSGYSASGFIVTGMGHQIGAYLNGGYGQRRPGGPMQTIDLEAGERVRDAVIRLWKGGAISGRILDEAAEPLVDVVVSAVRRAGDGTLLTGPTTKTDDRGMYRLGTLTPGTYVIVVPQTQTLMPLSTLETLLTAPADPAMAGRFSSAGAPVPAGVGARVGSLMLSAPPQMAVTNSVLPADPSNAGHVYQTTFHPSDTVASRATPLAIRSGEERSGVDVQLQPVRAVEVSGTLIDDGGAVPNFGVHLMPAETGDGSSVIEVATTATDAAGAFRFPLVPPGTYSLVAVRGGRPAAGAPQAAASKVSEMPGASAAVPVTVGGENVQGVLLTLRPGIRVTGQVEFDGVEEPPAPERLRQLTVALTPVRPLSRTNTGTASAVTTPERRFEIAGAAPGRYVLNARGLPPVWTLQAIAVGGRDVTDSVLALGAADVQNITIVFTDQPAEISGTVSGAAPSPPGDASVFLFPTDRSRWPDARATTRSFRVTRVSRAGTFVLSALVPGEYFVVAAADGSSGDWPDAALLEKLAESATTIRVGPKQKQSVQLRQVGVR